MNQQDTASAGPDTPGSQMARLYHELAQSAMRVTRREGRNETPIPGLGFYRHHHPETAMPCIYPLGIVLSLRGSKAVRYGEYHHHYGEGNLLFVGAELSALSYVSDCTNERPYLGMTLELDWTQLAEAVTRLPMHEASPEGSVPPLMQMPIDEGLLTAIRRLVALIDEPMLRSHLTPLIRTEIAYRLLTGSKGHLIRTMLANQSPLQQITRACAWIRAHQAEKISMSALARSVHMSESAFRQHFRRITRVSPLQYQKQLRLQQARQLMLSEHLTAAEAARRVGYDSPSQFSREYRRFFGLPPASDIGQHRHR